MGPASAVLAIFLFTAIGSCHGDGNEPPRGLKAIDVWGYLDRVVAALDAGVRTYGLSNLPVKDADMVLNRTVYGVPLLGVAKYSTGFVMDADSFQCYSRNLQTGVREDTAYVLTELSLPNVAVFYNLRAQLSVGDVAGTAIHTFHTNRLALHISYNMTSLSSTVTSMYPSSVSGPHTQYSPDTNITRAVARVARLCSSSVLWDDLKKWIEDLFIPIINSKVADMQIPFGVNNE